MEPFSFLVVHGLTSADNQTQRAVKTTKWEANLNDFIWTFEDDAPRFRNAKWKAVFDNQIKSTPLTITAFASPLFSLPLGEDVVKWTVWLTKENIWKRFSTLSQIAVLEGEALEVSVFSQCPDILHLFPNDCRLPRHAQSVSHTFH
jgi:hypothetical protein